MAKKKSLYGLAPALAIVCGILAIAGAFLAFRNVNENSFPRKIFAELSQLEMKYGAYRAEGAVNDRDLDKLLPLNSWCGEIEFEGESYKVFAYEFGSPEDAFEYFKNASGQKNAVEQLCFYYQGTSMGETKYAAYYDKVAYKVTGGRFDDFARFMTQLCADFPIDISEEYYQNYGIRLD